MALREDDSRDSKRGMSLGEQIRMWAGTAAKVAVVVVPVFAGLNYMINAEIEPVRKQISNVDVRLDKLDKTVEKEIGRVENTVEKEIGRVENTVEKEIGRVEGRVDQLDGKIEKFSNDMAAFRLEVLTWMARNEAYRQTDSDRSDGGKEGSADTSSLQPDGSAPTVPISSLPEARETICD